MSTVGQDAYFMAIADTAKRRSSCIRNSVGAVLVLEGRVVSTGYNGTPAGTRNCDDGGCQRCLDRNQDKLKPGEQKDRCVCCHAEENAIVQAARFGTSIRGSVLYTTRDPCPTCARMMINAGVTECVAGRPFEDALAERLLSEAGLKYRMAPPP